MSPNPGWRLACVVVVFCSGFSGCAAPPRWQTLADFPPELAVTALDLKALPPDEEELGKPIDQFPSAQLVGADIMDVRVTDGIVTLQYAVYVLPDEQLSIGNARYSSITRMFLSVGGNIPTEQGRFVVYDSEPNTKPPAAPSNHQSVIRNELIKSRRFPDRANTARTSIIDTDIEIPSTPPLVEDRAWCPLVNERIPFYCPVTKLALFNTVLGRGQVIVVSQQLIDFFSLYSAQHGFAHPVLMKLAGESWFKEVRSRIGLRKVELPLDAELLTEHRLNWMTALEGQPRDHGDAGMTTAEFYLELRRLDEEARKPHLSWMVENYLNAYTIGLLARYRPNTYTLEESTLQRWQNDSPPYGVLHWLYRSGYGDGLQGKLNPPTVIGMDCESEKTKRAKRRCEKAKQLVLDEIGK